MRILYAVSETLEWAVKDIKTELPIIHTVKTIYLEKRLVTDDEYKDAIIGLENLAVLGPTKEQLACNSILITSRNNYEEIISRYKSQKDKPMLPMELHVLKIGDIAFASNRFELYMDYQHRIQARSPFEQTFIIQLAGQAGNDGGTYLATERAMENKGYSASIYCNRVSAKGGQTLVEETVELLRMIFNQK